MAKKLSFEFVKQHIEKMGGELLSTSYNGNKRRLDVRCLKCGNVWHPKFMYIQDGNWCPECGGTKKHEHRYVEKFIENLNGKLLSKYENIDAKMDVLCLKCNCVWHPTFYSIKIGIWCPECNNIIRHNTSTVRKCIEDLGYQMLTDTYYNNSQALDVKCHKCKEVRKISFSVIRKSPQCPECFKKDRQASFCELIRSKNGLLICGYCETLDSIAEIKCLKCNNIWSPRFYDLHIGHWCPVCRESKWQKLIAKTIEKYFPQWVVMHNKRPFDGMRNPKTKSRLQIDIWCPEIKLAIEYDGEQHFRPVCFGGQSKKKAIASFKGIKMRDKIKDDFMKNTREVDHFIRFNCYQKLTEEFILQTIYKVLMGD